ncbi:DNA-3-methyladenine glycosylase 2 [Cellulomonas timonensis]|uniref:DNA-3-methyladenine glycosylase 2 n=1 Tax=Cellulomonas timonensis TaxID=1689271 RepID=UPI000834279D|nr:DNA-3-methyladenine glycosylase [Cellulomonas timonensis]
MTLTTADGIRLPLPHRQPFDAVAWYRHVSDRAIPGLEIAASSASTDASPSQGQHAVTRLLTGSAGPVRATVVLAADGSHLEAVVAGAAEGDIPTVTARLRRWLDLDADPAAISAALGDDPLIGPLIQARPGLRVPGTSDPFELAVRAVLGQQVSTSAARTVAGRLVRAFGEPGSHGLWLFPGPERLAALPVDALRALGLNTGRAAAIGVLARAVVDGLSLEPGPDVDVAQVRAQLVALRGIGPWTADYLALRALGAPDVFPAGDLVLRRALAELPGGAGAAVGERTAERIARRWSPWRSYAAQHLWSAWSARAVEARASRLPR